MKKDRQRHLVSRLLHHAPGMEPVICRRPHLTRRHRDKIVQYSRSQASTRWTAGNEPAQGAEQGTYGTLGRCTHWNAGRPTGRAPYGRGGSIVVGAQDTWAQGGAP